MLQMVKFSYTLNYGDELLETLQVCLKVMFKLIYKLLNIFWHLFIKLLNNNFESEKKVG